MKKVARVALIGMVVALAGCSSVTDSLGLGRNPPDEFAVVDRPPLTLPPDFDLRPPRPGAPRPQEVSMSDKAATTVFGTAAKGPHGSFMSGAAEASVEKSDSEKAVLELAGTAKADPQIRAVLDRETTQKIVGSRTLIDQVLWWRDTTPPAATVDAEAEAARLKEAKEKGESVSNGATPVIERGKSGWLGL